MAKKKNNVNLVECIYCQHTTQLSTGDIICTAKYKGEEITDYSRVDESTKQDCSFFKGIAK